MSKVVARIQLRREAAKISRAAMGIPESAQPAPLPRRRQVTLRVGYPLPDMVLNAWAREP
jgi:hypothetical protein